VQACGSKTTLEPARDTDQSAGLSLNAGLVAIWRNDDMSPFNASPCAKSPAATRRLYQRNNDPAMSPCDEPAATVRISAAVRPFNPSATWTSMQRPRAASRTLHVERARTDSTDFGRGWRALMRHVSDESLARGIPFRQSNRRFSRR
jgi:hypothetical protein